MIKQIYFLFLLPYFIAYPWLPSFAQMSPKDLRVTEKKQVSQDVVFVDGFDDLPLMTGLIQNPETTVVFDGTFGQIIESMAVTDLSKEDILTFYQENLYALGWHKKHATVFERDDNLLTLDFQFYEKEKLIVFRLEPLQ